MILSALKHPLRRKILRMLADKPLSFSEIRESVNIDSGHLNYHIKSIGDVVVHTEDGKYALSSVGLAAIELVSNVEEHDRSNRTNRRTKRVSRLALVFSAIFTVALLTASVYALTFATLDQRDLFKADRENAMVPVRIGPHQTLRYNITIIQSKSGSDCVCFVDQQKTIVYTPPTRNDFCEWTEYFPNIKLEWTEHAPNSEWEQIEYKPNINWTANRTYGFSLTIQDGVVLNDSFWGCTNGTTFKSCTLGPENPKLGNYSLQIENLGNEEGNATITLGGTYIVYERQLFGYGIAGVIVLIIYPVLLFWSWNGDKKLRSKQTAIKPPFQP